MAGVKEAKAGLLGFNPIALATGLALGGLVMAGKAAIAISQEHFIAENNLTNAIKNKNLSLDDAKSRLADFMKVNRDFIGNQNEVINAYASLIREGVKQTDVTKLLSLALNIQAVEGGSLSDSVTKLQQAEAGRNRGLITQVGLVLKAIPAHATLAQKQAIIAYNVKQITKAYGSQKPVVDPLQVATNKLKVDWELMAEKYGPGLITTMANIATSIDEHLPSWLHWLDVIGGIAAQLGAIGDGGFGIGFAGGAPIRPGATGAGGIGGGALHPKPPPPGRVGAGGIAGHLTHHPTAQVVLHGPVTIVHSDAHAKQLSDSIRRVNRSFR